MVGDCHLRLTGRCRHPAPGQDLIPLQRLHVFANSRTGILSWNCGVKYYSPNPKQFFQLKYNVCNAFLRSNYIKSRTFNDKNRWIIKEVLSLRSCFLILPSGALTPQGIEGARKRDMSKHWCTLQWCANRGWFIAHGNWTSCPCHVSNILSYMNVGV